MKILYVAKHNPFDNEDELAIAHALRELGHQVEQVMEFNGHSCPRISADFCLFHKWSDYEVMRLTAKNMPLVCWFFDQMDSSFDIELSERTQHRLAWAAEITDIVSLFCLTDGDWVNRDKTGKLRWLCQGADERKIGPGNAAECHEWVPEILFHGTISHGVKRSQHIQHLVNRWGTRFGVIGSGRPATRRHGRALANILAKAAVTISPDGLQTDHYWSNRVYLVNGFAGFLLHPYCEGLSEHYDWRQLATYQSYNELDSLISYYLSGVGAQEREQLRFNAFEETKKRHLYRHRVEKLLEYVKELK